MAGPLLSTLDTIVAVASPRGVSGRAIVRASGALAWQLIERHAAAGVRLEDLRGFDGRTVELRAGDLLFSAWVSFFKSPRSYTTESMVEVHVPGAEPVVAALIRSFCAIDGVRLAGPGEFTLRAFLGGRIDLSRAEAVEQLISASDEREARAAKRSLGGELERRVRSIVDQLVESIALLEAALDFPDEDLPDIAPAPVLARLDHVAELVDGLRASSTLRLATAGAIHVAIAGFPNAGKSSLLNALAGGSAALVSSFAGTTRDPVRVRIDHGGTEVEWVDLAGSRDYGESPGSGLEGQLDLDALRMLRRLCQVELDGADVVVWVTDPLSDPDSSAEVRERVAPGSIWLISKADRLSSADRRRWGSAVEGQGCLVSATVGRGLDALIEQVIARGHGETALASEGATPVSAHQEAALIEAAEASSRACAALRSGLGYEFAASDLRAALRSLREIAGDVTTEDILGHIFGRFCIGKRLPGTPIARAVAR